MRTPALVCAAVEVALNRYLRLEPSALAACAALDGRCIAFDIAEPGWMFAIEPNAGGVRVLADHAAPDVRVRAPTLRYLQLALATVRGQRGLPTGLEVEGDTELLARFNGILAGVGFDPEELASKLVGDAAAHRVVGSLKSLLGFGRHAATRFTEDAAEYLVEEREDLARLDDVEEWMNAVDLLREDVDRFEARLARIEGTRGT